ncbi:ATP-dependent RNA helicase DDX55, putative [Entamoeba histolytica HM-3:IMSS]|uniref:ATP-dependent RNA helicase n=6 Tax=Entamoeba histolytica TaxID=5759 RepID=C4LSG3_ENTH1|nr:DEAD/DEAH box helicase, putative [Entamoeba histolytica HM-1:IMSS]EMD44066.1 ATPdependent RNA helicase DDX55, putative [Entamoeba histolytica KU27]EMS11413.1 ATP-dependent RNA helicase DDX55, putative [Entamoeba histolytica HM-3:IMSS]ENY61869.1 ATP-dependent RNA helicase DDX55, putative [Entamoeba histolytica HM-1:IMSS-A]GAT91366.1 dead deah box helicase putative [Entamoeba histolytica]EAL52039.2 DEAD/DEAH box helicase, putative [Entamoeba histolytica HM-1:IMSS]|eukprot:XP_657423.2 DEAD/DEAH box helicase, putative [Entamoeba histolytica HM-1:IMSS]
MISDFEHFQPSLRKETLDTIKEFGFSKPTEVQKVVIPAFLDRKDVIVQSQTGSGKTLSFLIPLFEIIKRERESIEKKEVYGIIISPTRELAHQIYDIAKIFCKHFNMTIGLLTGGIDISTLEEEMKKGANIVVGTAGRIEEVIVNKLFELEWNNVEVLILDEGDRMIEMGFSQSMTRIICHLPKQRRTGLFSATMPKELNKFVIAGCRNPYKIQISNDNTLTPISLANEYCIVPYEIKMQTLIRVLKESKDKKIVVFVLTCDQVDYIYNIIKILHQEGYLKEKEIYSIHGKVKQVNRDKVIKKFEESCEAILICTDVLARGMDFDNINYIIQYDPPQDPKTYIHRVGRTARMGSIGHSLIFLGPLEKSFILLMEKKNVKIIERTIERNEEEEKEYFNKIREICCKNRTVFKKSQNAFVSFCKGYGEHQCKYIFAIKKLVYNEVAKGMCLVKMPKIQEVKRMGIKYEEEMSIEENEIPFADERLEQQRQERGKKRKEKGV